MFEKIKKAVMAATESAVPFDASRFNDPLAMQIEWGPAKKGGASFKTHTFASDGFNRAEFKTSVGAKLFCFLFIGAGITFPVLFGMNELYNESTLFYEKLLPVAFGLIFVAAGGFLYYINGSPVVFDKVKGCYWRSWKKPDHNTNRSMMKNFARLHEIHALQIVQEYIRGNKSSYYSFELNLVLKDGTRLNVVDHGNINSLRKDARQLADFLGKPLWDAGS
jgi:hypothetical protein